jgi:hypothetical protein
VERARKMSSRPFLASFHATRASPSGFSSTVGETALASDAAGR